MEHLGDQNEGKKAANVMTICTGTISFACGAAKLYTGRWWNAWQFCATKWSLCIIWPPWIHLSTSRRTQAWITIF